MRKPGHPAVLLCSACRGDCEDPDAAATEDEEEDGDEPVEEFPA